MISLPYVFAWREPILISSVPNSGADYGKWCAAWEDGKITKGVARCLMHGTTVLLSCMCTLPPVTGDPEFVCIGATAADAGKHTGGGSLGMQKACFMCSICSMHRFHSSAHSRRNRNESFAVFPRRQVRGTLAILQLVRASILVLRRVVLRQQRHVHDGAAREVSSWERRA